MLGKRLWNILNYTLCSTTRWMHRKTCLHKFWTEHLLIKSCTEIWLYELWNSPPDRNKSRHFTIHAACSSSWGSEVSRICNWIVYKLKSNWSAQVWWPITIYIVANACQGFLRAALTTFCNGTIFHEYSAPPFLNNGCSRFYIRNGTLFLVNTT